jgi:hypothetical protein
VTYPLYGLMVASNIELPELDSIHSANPSCYFELLAQPPLPEPIADEWIYHYYLPSGKLWRSCAKLDAGFLLRFHNQADFFVSSDGKRVTMPSNS